MTQTAREKIRALRALHEDGLLSLQEFDLRKNAILDAEYAPPGGSVVSPRARQGTEIGLMTGQEIGPQNRRYRLERLIAHGGMGQVWEATDLATHFELGHSAPVALKILPPQFTNSATLAKLLIEEATQARRLAHENIVRVYEWAQDPATSSYFVIMECLEGEDLDQLLASQGCLSLERTLELLEPLAHALDYAWDKHQLVHRDIKPGNVFLTRGGEIKLLDFGIAARARDGASRIGLEAPVGSGTAGYRSPEAMTHQGKPNRAQDVYAVAVMVYQMLEGVMPFDGTRSAQHEPQAPQALSARQWSMLRAGFAYRDDMRPRSVTALLAGLRLPVGPTPEEVAAQQEAERAQQEAERAQQEAERRRAQELTEQRRAEAHAQAQAAAAAQLLAERQRKEQQALDRARAEESARVRKEQLRAQLLARREADAAQARLEKEERQRKFQQAKAAAAYRAEQARARDELAARAVAELAAQLPSLSSPVADPDGVLRDLFIDGAGRGPELVLIPNGRFHMGSHEVERNKAMAAGALASWVERETPQHWVGIEQSFALGRYPVTLGQWRQFVRATEWQSQAEVRWDAPGFAQDDEHPVVGVSWDDAQRYLAWLSTCTGQRYRLPSEAQWEYACRAGSKSAFCVGDAIGAGQACFDASVAYNGGALGARRHGTARVGSFAPNAWGLFDMHGNVWEWVQDKVHPNYDGAPTDGHAWEQGGDPARRVLRGGSWTNAGHFLRSALRNGFAAANCNEIVGFRVARELV